MVSGQGKPKNAILIELHYLPCVVFFTYLLQFDKVLIEAHENYQRQTYRNRCRIMGPNRVVELSVPVVKPPGKIKIREALIDNRRNWAQHQWRSLRASYGKAPFFEFFADDFYQVLNKGHTYLFDFNLRLLETALRILNIDRKIELTTSYQTVISPNTFDARAIIQPTQTHSEMRYFEPTKYHQIFGNKFVPNLSIVDLIFCEGTNAYEVLGTSFRNS